MTETDEQFIQKYNLHDRRGNINKSLWEESSHQGSESIIYKPKGINTHGDIVIRVENSDEYDVKDSKEFEKKLGESGEHENILTAKDSTPKYSAYDNQNSGDMENYIRKEYNSPIDLKKRLDMCKGIIRGVRHIHNNGLVHYDIKPDNILLNEINGVLHPKIADFGRLWSFDKPSPQKDVLTPRYYPNYPISRLRSNDTDKRFMDIHALCFTLIGLLAWHPEILCAEGALDGDGDSSGCVGPHYGVESNIIYNYGSIRDNLVYLVDGPGTFYNKHANLRTNLNEINNIRKIMMDRKNKVLQDIDVILENRSDYKLVDMGKFGEELWRGIMGLDFASDSRTTTTDLLLSSLESFYNSV